MFPLLLDRVVRPPCSLRRPLLLLGQAFIILSSLNLKALLSFRQDGVHFIGRRRDMFLIMGKRNLLVSFLVSRRFLSLFGLITSCGNLLFLGTLPPRLLLVWYIALPLVTKIRHVFGVTRILLLRRTLVLPLTLDRNWHRALIRRFLRLLALVLRWDIRPHR